MLGRVRRESPFYRDRIPPPSIGRGLSDDALLASTPVVRPTELAEVKLGTGDLYANRLALGRQALVTFQLDSVEDTPLYQGFDARDLQASAEALRRCLALLGAATGDVIAIYDYGTSPVTYLASGLYTPYLRTGAADAIGCRTICNDGVPSMSQRAVEILELVRPRFLLIRTECVHPFVAACEARAIRADRYTEALVVTYDEGPRPFGLDALCRERLGIPLLELPRADLSSFLAIECPDCHLLHTWSDLYTVELVDAETLLRVAPDVAGAVVVTNRFNRVCPAVRILSRLQARRVEPGCPRGPADLRLCA